METKELERLVACAELRNPKQYNASRERYLAEISFKADAEKRNKVMDVIPSETIYSDGDVIIPMADVQHIEKRYYKGDLMGILIITRHTRWDMEADCWANNIWIGQEKADGFIRAWCFFRYEVDGIKKQAKGQ